MPSDYYFFSLSYSNIPAILSIAERLDSTESNVHIIVHIESHRLFWQELIKVNHLKWQVIFLDISREGSLKNPLSWFQTRQSLKRTFQAQFQALHNAHVYFFSLSPPLPVLAMIDRLARRNTIYFLDCDQRDFPKWRGLRNRAYRFLVRIIYEIDVDMVRIGDSAAPFLSEDFIKQAQVQQLTGQHYYDVAILKKYDFVGDDIKAGKRLVVLDDDCYLYEAPSNGETGKALSTLKKVIASKFPDREVLYKRHPNPAFHTRNFDSIYGDYVEYPYYVPADFIFFNPDIELVIGGFSTTLALAAKHFNTRAISYLKLIPFQNEVFKDSIIETLRSESNDKIAFPDSWEELNSLLTGSMKEPS